MNDISLKRAAAAVGGGLLNAPFGAVGILGSTAKNLIPATVNSYRALYHENRVDWSLKAVIGGVGIPGTAALALPTALVGGAGWGLVNGFSSVLDDKSGFLRSFADTWDGIKWYDKSCWKQVVDLGQYRPSPLEEGEKPYSLKLIESASGLVVGVTSFAPFALAVGGITLARTPQGWWRVMKDTWRDGRDTPIRSSVETIALSAAALLAAPLALTGGALFSFGGGLYQGYEKGMGDGFKEVADWVRRYNEFATEFVEK